MKQNLWFSIILTFLAVWLNTYFVLGALYVSNGDTSFLARTVDRIDQTWVKLVFLKIPLQLIPAVVAISYLRARGPTAWRTGFSLATANSLLIGVHVALSIATA